MPWGTNSSVRSPAQRSRTFAGILVNTALANVTTSYLWFALTFWVYLETRSVVATGTHLSHPRTEAAVLKALRLAPSPRCSSCRRASCRTSTGSRRPHRSTPQ